MNLNITRTNMNNTNYLPNDLMNLILTIRTQEMVKVLDKKIENWREEHEEQFMYVDNQISEYFVSELARYEHLSLEEDCIYFSPFHVLKMLREEKEENKEIEEDYGNYY